MRYVNSYQYSLFQVVLLAILNTIGEIVEYNLDGNIYSICIKIGLAIISFHSWYHLNYSYKLSEKTILYTLCLIVSISAKTAIKIYCIFWRIPLYQNHILKSAYMALKPFYYQYVTTVPSYYTGLNILHLLGAFIIAGTIQESSSFLALALLHECIDLFLIGELEDRFSVEILLPELYYFLELMGELTGTTIASLIVPGCYSYSTALVDIPLLLTYLGVELATFALFIYYREIRFTPRREGILQMFDAHICNTVNAFVIVFEHLNTHITYTRNTRILDTWFHIHAAIIPYLFLLFFQLVLYMVELLLAYYASSDTAVYT